MQIQIFNIPISDNGELLAEMNRFLGTRKVLEVEQKFFQNEKGGYWTFCARYLSDPSLDGGSAGKGTAGSGRTKPDYKQLLPAEQFAVFSRLRELRKGLASEDGVPAYAVFTDEELSKIAQLPVLTPQAMRSIPGIGEKKMERYGKTLLERYAAASAVAPDLSVSGEEGGGALCEKGGWG